MKRTDRSETEGNEVVKGKYDCIRKKYDEKYLWHHLLFLSESHQGL